VAVTFFARFTKSVWADFVNYSSKLAPIFDPFKKAASERHTNSMYVENVIYSVFNAQIHFQAAKFFSSVQIYFQTLKIVSKQFQSSKTRFKPLSIV